MEKLTKENFWNDLNARYPKGMKVFCDWIDEYKKRVNWNQLFRNGPFLSFENDEITKPIQGEQNVKFHDIPGEMQIGIYIQFLSDINRDELTVIGLDTDTWRAHITECIEWLHERTPDPVKEYTKEEIEAAKERISKMEHYEMCKLWRFHPVGEDNILLRNDLGTGQLFKDRLFGHFGGFTPQISKSLGWK